MDFGVLDGFTSSENKNTFISCGDSDLKTKWVGSGGGYCKQENSNFSTTTHEEDEWRNLKMAKINEDDIPKTMPLQQQQRFNQNMLSFSSPNTQTVTFPYYARNTNIGFGGGGPFTPSQWMELEHQALIYKYINANAAIPSTLLIPIKKALENAAFSAYSGSNLRQNSYGWGALNFGFCNNSDPEPGRCRRTDGKKWRCAKDAVVDQKYCERHMNRGRHRSRKPVEAQNCHSIPTGGAAAKITTGDTSLRRTTTTPIPAASSQDNRSGLMLSSSSVEKNHLTTPDEPSCVSEFGLVCSDSLLNPMHKNDLKSQNPLHEFIEDWPHSNRTPLSISIATSPASESIDLSPLRMGLGMGKMTNRVPGGPLGEVLQHSTNNSPSALNLLTDCWDNNRQMAPPSRKTPLGLL